MCAHAACSCCVQLRWGPASRPKALEKAIFREYDFPLAASGNGRYRPIEAPNQLHYITECYSMKDDLQEYSELCKAARVLAIAHSDRHAKDVGLCS